MFLRVCRLYFPGGLAPRYMVYTNMKLSYDSIDYYKTPEELIFRLRLWTDPALEKSPLLMASEAEGWKGKSVINVSEDIYSFFMGQNIYSSALKKDEDIIKKTTKHDTVHVLAKLQKKISDGLFNIGAIHDEISLIKWLGPKIAACLTDMKQIISKYFEESCTLKDAYENILFFEHCSARLEYSQDWLSKEKFFVVSYKEGARDQKSIVMTRAAMEREFGIKCI